jgi:hypothetical protein
MAALPILVFFQHYPVSIRHGPTVDNISTYVRSEHTIPVSAAGPARAAYEADTAVVGFTCKSQMP